MNVHLERGKLLLAQNRVREAEQEFIKALERNPNDGYAMAWLAECALHQKDFKKALELSEHAIALSPNNTFLLYTLSRSYFYNKKIKEAQNTIDQALLLNPNDADFFLLRAHIAFYQERWADALTAVEQGLEQEPENVNLINLRTQALVKLNRKSEAKETIDYALHHAPENSYSHANKGWVAIEQNQYQEAFTHFREALRLDPDNVYARSGLKEAIKARNILYRGVLKYFLWMAKMDAKNRWFFIIGAYVLYRLIIVAAEKIPAIAPLLYPLIAFYILFALSSWIAMPLSNFFLRLHPLGKHALSDDEKLASNITGGLIGAALLAGIGYLASGQNLLLMLALFCLLMLIPVGGLFSVQAEGKARKKLLYYTIALGVTGLFGVFVPSANLLIYVFLIGVFAYSWIANFLIGQDAREF
jgi:tetratricopeptide (TPR) repeat protein